MSTDYGNQDVPTVMDYGQFQCRGCQAKLDDIPTARWHICPCGTVYDRLSEESMPYDQWLELEGAWAFKEGRRH